MSKAFVKPSWLLLGIVLGVYLPSCTIEEPEITAELVGTTVDVPVHKPLQIAFSDPVDDFPDVSFAPSADIEKMILNAGDDTLTLTFSNPLSNEVAYEIGLSGKNIVTDSLYFTTIATVDNVENDSYEDAQPMESDKKYGGLINTIFGEPDQDWYKMQGIAAGGMISILLDELDEDLNLSLFNPDGTELSASSNTGNTSETIEIAAAQTGTHYIRVFTTLSNPSSYYHITTEF